MSYMSCVATPAAGKRNVGVTNTSSIHARYRPSPKKNTRMAGIHGNNGPGGRTPASFFGMASESTACSSSAHAPSRAFVNGASQRSGSEPRFSSGRSASPRSASDTVRSGIAPPLMDASHPLSVSPF